MAAHRTCQTIGTNRTVARAWLWRRARGPRRPEVDGCGARRAARRVHVPPDPVGALDVDTGAAGARGAPVFSVDHCCWHGASPTGSPSTAPRCAGRRRGPTGPTRCGWGRAVSAAAAAHLAPAVVGE